MLQTLEMSVSVALFVAILSCMVPDALFFFCYGLRRLLPKGLRHTLLLIWSFGGALFGTACAVALLWLWSLHLLAYSRLRNFLCEPNPETTVFRDSFLVGTCSLLLLLLFSRLFLDRIVAATCGATPTGFLMRVGRSLKAGALWWLLMEHSTLAVPVAIVLAVDWAGARVLNISDLLDYARPARKRVKIAYQLCLLGGYLSLALCGGEAYRDDCAASKKHASSVVLYSVLTTWSLGRKLLRAYLEHRLVAQRS